MKSGLPLLDRNPPRPDARSGLEGRILRLVKGGAERRAIESGQVDAVIDQASGKVFLLPEAQQALREAEARIRGLLALSADGCWEQDEHYRFVSHSGTSSRGIFDESILGKTLWDLPFDNTGATDWDTHRRQLEWRATFHDLELTWVDHAGEVRHVSIDGEPLFDDQQQFKGYRGTARDITLRKQTEALAQKPNRFARDALDALPAQVCVLDSAGIVIMANKAWDAFAGDNDSLGAAVLEGDNYLAACDQADGDERADGIAIAAGIRRVMAGDSQPFRHEYACDSTNGRCWFNLTVTRFAGDGAARVVVSRENVAERKHAEPIPANGAARAVVTRGNIAKRKREQPLVGREYKIAKGARAANSLLAALPRKDYRRLLAGLEPVTLNYGDVLYEPGESIQHVYFPNDSLVSLLTTIEGHQALEVGLVGREGMVGLSLALGIGVSPVRALVQGTGTAMRMQSAQFSKEFRRCLPLQRALYRHAYSMLGQVRQTAACNRFHQVDARLARWLLMTHDRVQSDEFLLTQEFLADMLGVRRAGVTNAASALQRHKLISYRRGKIRILDRKGLEAASCSCYEIVANLYDGASAA
jgi:PAS domain S-box-containing protein